MKKILLLTILLTLFITTYSQIICSAHVPNMAFGFRKPVVNGQVVAYLTGCDQDVNSYLSWKFIYGNSANYWEIVSNPNDNTTAFIRVRNAKQINKSVTRTYTLKAVVYDQYLLQSPACTVKLSVIL